MNIRSDIVRVYLEVHTWVGIICGLFLFIGFYAGAITMFEIPLQRWSSPPIHKETITPIKQTDVLIAKALEKHPEVLNNFKIIINPEPEHPGRIYWESRPAGADDHTPAIHYYANLDEKGELKIVEKSPSTIAQLIDTIHQQLGLLFDHEIIMPVVGIIALFYGLALISGTIVLLPTLIKDAFAVRIGKNLKRMWLDLHNVIGLFSLPFHLVIALTSIIFALHDNFYDAQKALIYPKPKAKQGPVNTHRKVPAIDTKELIPVQSIITLVKKYEPEYAPIYLNYLIGPGQKFMLFVGGSDPRYHANRPREGLLGIDPYNGKVISTDYMPGQQGIWYATVSSFFALHFGNYGGNFIRWCYFFLGISGAFLFYTGNLLWIEKRRKKRNTPQQTAPEQTKASKLLGSLTVGVSLGCVAGISLIIACGKMIPEFIEGVFSSEHAGLYYLVFLLAILWAFIRGAAKGAVELLFTSSVITALIPLASVLSFIIPGFGWNHGDSTIWVDIIACIGVIVFSYLAFKTKARIQQAPVNSIWHAKLF